MRAVCLCRHGRPAWRDAIATNDTARVTGEGEPSGEEEGGEEEEEEEEEEEGDDGEEEGTEGEDEVAAF